MPCLDCPARALALRFVTHVSRYVGTITVTHINGAATDGATRRQPAGLRGDLL
jgi:hypothetical protein